MGIFRYFCTKIENCKQIMAKKKKEKKLKPASSFSEALGLKHIFGNEILWIFMGFLIIAVAVYMVIAFISYLTTGAADQTMIENPREGELMKKTLNANVVVASDRLYCSVRKVIQEAQGAVSRVANWAMVESNWRIGFLIVEDEQKGKRKAEYGKTVLKDLARRLTSEYGSGYDESNLRYMRLFYLAFPIRNALRSELSWMQKELCRLQLQDMVELNDEAAQVCSVHKVKKRRKVK